MAIEKRPRFEAMDCAKGLAMVSVIVGHSPSIPDLLRRFCFTFHMPFFFFASGFFSKEEGLSRQYVRKQFKSLVVPYCATSIILVALMTLKAAFGPAPLIPTFTSWTLACLYGSGGVFPGMPDGVIAVGAIWFLLALFWAKLFLAAVHKTGHPTVWVLGLFALGLKTKEFVWLPFSIQAGMCACLFLYIGQRFKSSASVVEGQGKLAIRLPAILWACLAFCWVYCILHAGHLYMVSNTYENGVLDILGGISGSLCLIKLCGLLCAYGPRIARPLMWLGRNTLPILCMHLVELNVFGSLLWRLGETTWLIPLALQFAFTAVLVSMLYFAPRFVSSPFFASRRQKG